jgi:hypothetical protein
MTRSGLKSPARHPRGARIAALLAIVALVCAGLSAVQTASAAYAITGITTSADPTEDKTVTVTASGTLDAGKYVWVVRKSTSDPCPATASAAYSSGWSYMNLGGDYYGAGSFSESNSFTPAEAGTVRVCAYVGESSTSTPLAVRSHDFTVRLPTASLASITVSADPTEDRSVTVTVAGTIEVGRYVWVVRKSTSDPCPATASAAYSSGWSYMNLGGDYYGAGSFSESNSFTPAEAGTVRVCAYVGESSTSTPLAVRSHDFTVSPNPDRPPSFFPSPGSGSSGQAGQSACAHIPSVPTGLEASIDASRRPFLSWKADPNGTDRALIFEGEDGVADIRRDGLMVWPADPDGDPEPDPEKGSVVDAPGGRLSASLLLGLPPGSYTWKVVRQPAGSEDCYGTPKTAEASGAFSVVGPPLTSLKVKAVAVPGSTYKYPGYTAFHITAAPFARVRITLQRGKSKSAYAMAWGTRAFGVHSVDWKCPSAGPRQVKYEVWARDGFGARRAVTGTFQVVGAGACETMRRKEEAARARAQAAATARARRAAAAAAAAAQSRVNRYKSNCWALGGTPVLLQLWSGKTWFCRSPYGGTMYVPW